MNRRSLDRSSHIFSGQYGSWSRHTYVHQKSYEIPMYKSRNALRMMWLQFDLILLQFAQLEYYSLEHASNVSRKTVQSTIGIGGFRNSSWQQSVFRLRNPNVGRFMTDTMSICICICVCICICICVCIFICILSVFSIVFVIVFISVLATVCSDWALQRHEESKYCLVNGWHYALLMADTIPYLR